jgi:transglutaminase-like putative cysteine protease
VLFKRIKRPVAATVLVTFLSLVLQPLAVLAQDRPQTPAAKRQTESGEERFSRTLSEIHEILKYVAPRSSSGERQLRAIGPNVSIETEAPKPLPGVNVADKVKLLRAKAEELASLEAHVRAGFEATGRQLREGAFPAEILARHEEAVRSYEARSAEFWLLMSGVERAASGTALQAALGHLETFMAKYPNQRAHSPTDPANLPWGGARAVGREPRTTPAQFKSSALFGAPLMVAQAGSLSGIGLPSATPPAAPVAADLSETEEVQLTQAVRDLAGSLGNNPVRIYNWVRNNIRFVPTYGSIQGSAVTLQTRRGNAFDTASLLIALLRAANVPARYVYGTVQAPAAKVMNWVGGASVPQAAVGLMADGGIPVVGVRQGGQLSLIRFEHVWVEAYVDYVPSRGAVNRNPDSWVPLDASFKQYQYTAPLDIGTGAPFAADQLVSAVQQGTIVNETEGWVQNLDQAAVEQALAAHRAQVTGYVFSQKPNATVADVIGDQAIVQEDRPILLGTLPYALLATGAKFQALPDGLRHKLSLKLYTSELERADDSPALSYSASIPALAGKRLSFTYRPAAAADQAVLDAAHAARNGSFAAYLVRFTPTVKLEDAVVASGGSYATGQAHSLVVSVIGPWGERPRNYSVTAGDFWVMGLNPAGVTREMYLARTQQHDLTRADPPQTEEIFHQIALGWWGEKYALNDVFGATHEVIQYQMPSHALAGSPLSLRFQFGIARSASYKSRVLDAKEDTLVAGHRAAATEHSRRFLKAAGQAGSHLEAGIFDQSFLMPPGQSMSAMTALKAAMDGGQRIYTITQANEFALGHIQTHPDDLQDMRNAVAAGLTVTTSQSDVAAAGGFTGLGYILEDPLTGAAAYLISGGRNGGNSPAPTDSVFPLPEVPANGAAALLINMSARSAGAELVTTAAAGARAGAAVGGIVIGGGLGGFLAILGLLLLILLLLYLIVTAIDTLYPPTTERVRHYTRAFDSFRRNPDGSHKDPTDPPRDIIQIESYLIGGILKASPDTATFGPGVYFGDRTDSLPGVGSQILFSCPPTSPQAQAVVTGYALNPQGETATERVSAWIDITFTRENWPPRQRFTNANNLSEIVVRMPYFFYIRGASYFGVTHDETCGLF